MRANEKKGNQFGDWTLVELLGAGGNAEAWRAEDSAGAIRVIKILNRVSEEGYERFKREVAVLQRIVPEGFPAIPIEEAYLPEAASRKDKPFCVMPEAVRIDKALRGADVRDKVLAIKAIAQALVSLLREHGMHHRDVKPANLYLFEDRFVLGDFGLVIDPATDASLTADGKPVGPWEFLPSEVFHPLGPIDWEKVDVYCLAMTLWCLVMEKDSPPRRIATGGIASLSRQLAVPERVTDPWTEEDLSLSEYRQHVRELDELLAAATSDDPVDRPTLAKFVAGLENWDYGIGVRDDFQMQIEKSNADEQSLLEWLVRFGRSDTSLGRAMISVENLDEESLVPGMTQLDFSNALDGLVGGRWATAEPIVTNRITPYHWSHVYPTSFGIDRIERERLNSEVLPLLREIVRLQQIELLEFSGDDESAALGAVSMAGSELYFLLRYMEGSYLIEYRETYLNNNGVMLLDLKATSIGRQHVLNRT